MSRDPVVDARLLASDMGPSGLQTQMDQLDGLHMVAERAPDPCPSRRRCTPAGLAAGI